ncbi:response regulator [Bacillus tianshenii]|nr:response regulator [Bacillus tianshenii]
MNKGRDYSKYQKLHIEMVKKKINGWLHNDEIISSDEVIRFFHSVKGTAASINLFEVSEHAEIIHDKVVTADKQSWRKEELELLMVSFIKVVYQYDEFIVAPDVMKKPSKNKGKFILIIDDDYSMLQYLKHSLEEYGYHVLATLHPDQAVHLWYNLEPDCVIIDVHLPRKNGFEVIREIQQSDTVFLTPVIMISVENTKETRITAFETGADDFMAKPFDIDEMVVRIERQITKREAFERNTLIDYLTGAFNRQFLEKELEHRLGEYRRTKKPFVITLLDLDYFKKVNDVYGHLVGDEVLKRFVKYLLAHIREYDYVIRYGGEEFVLLFPNTTAAEAELIVERFLVGFSKEVFETKKGNFHVTFSSGLIEIDNPNLHGKEWLELADNALYKAKQNGRNQIVTAHSEGEQEKEKEVFNIAVIDDDYIVRSMLEDHFLDTFAEHHSYHFNIKMFENGELFIEDEWHKKNEPFLIILDRMMPKLDGLEVLQYLRKHFPVHRYHIIMLTSRNSEEDVSRAIKLGADDYVTKPFSIIEFEARIKRMLQRMK